MLIKGGVLSNGRLLRTETAGPQAFKKEKAILESEEGQSFKAMVRRRFSSFVSANAIGIHLTTDNEDTGWVRFTS